MWGEGGGGLDFVATKRMDLPKKSASIRPCSAEAILAVCYVWYWQRYICPLVMVVLLTNGSGDPWFMSVCTVNADSPKYEQVI